MARLIIVDDILKDKNYPFRDVHFEKFVFPDKFSDNLVNSVVKFDKFVPFVMLIWKYIFLDVHLHVEKKLKK